jgi:hypothetical protein
MALEKAEFSGAEGIVELDVEAMTREEAQEVLQTAADAIEKEHGFERYR